MKRKVISFLVHKRNLIKKTTNVFLIIITKDGKIFKCPSNKKGILLSGYAKYTTFWQRRKKQTIKLICAKKKRIRLAMKIFFPMLL